MNLSSVCHRNLTVAVGCIQFATVHIKFNSTQDHGIHCFFLCLNIFLKKYTRVINSGWCLPLREGFTGKRF